MLEAQGSVSLTLKLVLVVGIRPLHHLTLSPPAYRAIS